MTLVAHAKPAHDGAPCFVARASKGLLIVLSSSDSKYRVTGVAPPMRGLVGSGSELQRKACAADRPQYKGVDRLVRSGKHPAPNYQDALPFPGNFAILVRLWQALMHTKRPCRGSSVNDPTS